uniref:Corticotropin-releasing factor-binding protein n=1 Tax=Coturnix japonica TaxID=93934 RepID=A0A8C2T6Q8_COTJA
MPRRLLPAGSEQQVLSAHGGAATMSSAFQLQCHLVLILLAASKGDTRYIEVSNGASAPRCTSLLSSNFISSRCALLSSVPTPTAPGHRTDINTHPLHFHSFPRPFLDLVLLAKGPRLTVLGSPRRGRVAPRCSSPDRAVMQLYPFRSRQVSLESCREGLRFALSHPFPTVPPQVRDAGEDEPFLLLSEDLKRELSAGHIYRRSLRCIDMLSIEGQFTFTADQPQLHCATFFIGEPEELLTIEYDFVNIDCQGGDFLKVFDGWILKGEKFPSSLDHPLPTSQRYTDFCESGAVQRSIRSSQNVAMIFFRIHQPGNGFTITVKKSANLFPCNVISQTPSGRFTMIIPHQHRNCSFSIIYPVVIKISDLILGHLNGLFLKVSCLLPGK